MRGGELKSKIEEQMIRKAKFIVTIEKVINLMKYTFTIFF
jgi:hypothetical protein